MKKIYLAYLLLALLSACKQKDNQAVSLQGEIAGLGNDTLYLYGTDGWYQHTDTLVAQNNKLRATLHPDTLVSLRLRFKDGTEQPLFLNKKDRITLKGSTDALQQLEVTGSLPNDELTAFRKELAEAPESTSPEEKAKEFIQAHPASPASVYLLEEYFVKVPEPDFNLIKSLTERMVGQLKDLPSMMSLTDRIQEAEKNRTGKTILHFELPNAKGEQVNRNSHFKDKYVLLHFWASWDPQSTQANAAMRRVYKRTEKSKVFALWGISLDVDRHAWEEAIRRDTLKWEQVCDFRGWQTSPVGQLGLQAIPTNLLLNPSGRIEARDLSEEAIISRWEEIEQREKEKKEAEKQQKKSVRRH